MDEILAQAASHGGDAPKHNADGDEFGTREAVGDVSQRQTHEGIEQ